MAEERLKSLGYIRVDTGDTTHVSMRDQQQWAIARFARRNGYLHLNDVSDVGWARRPEECPGFRQVLAAARERRFSRLLVWRLDRMPGNSSAVLQTLLSLHEQYGVTVRSVSEPIDLTSGTTRSLIGALAGIGTQERRELAQLRGHAKHRKAAQGELASGAVPFGYLLGPSGDLVIDPDAAAVIRRIYGMREDGLSLRAIAEALNASGVPTRRGGRWHAGTVRYILENPKYRGWISYNFKDEHGFILRQGAHAAIIG